MTKQTRDIIEILRGGYCTRWHANPDLAHIRETLAEHHASVAQIILALHPSPSLRLIDAALHHDAGEPAVGDVPWPVKRDNPALAFTLEAAEEDAREALGCNIRLEGEDLLWLKLADRLAAIMHVGMVRPDLLDRDDWQQDMNDCVETAEALGVTQNVVALVKGMQG